MRHGPAAFAFCLERPRLPLFLWRFGSGPYGLPWSHSPFNWWRVPAAERLAPCPDEQGRLTLAVILIEAESGVIRALRTVALSPTFSAALVANVAAQQADGPLSVAEEASWYRAAVTRHPTAEGMAAAATVRCQSPSCVRPLPGP